MVEFGLQLEDNKVDEWSAQYIDYERLRSMLTRAKKYADLRDEIIKRMPSDLVSEVMEGRIDWSAGYPSTRDEKKLDAMGAAGSIEVPLGDAPVHRKLETIDSEETMDFTNVNTPLLRMTSFARKSSMTTRNSPPLLQFLGLANNREMILNAYADADDKLGSFEQAYEQELAKVDNFYQDKTNEISQRVDGLLESVDASFVKPPKKNHHRRSTSLEAWVINKFGPMIHGDRLRPVVPQDQGSALPDIERVFSASSYHNEDDDSEKKRKELERVKKSDSIQRAITDIYRTAKLLHNFCILNYTGFSEVAGMFDRTFPVHKGTFKGKLCDDGKQTEMLATKMEKMYSTWFCEGDVLKAQAQMLPKRGDGLLMDWSQMRLGYRLGMCSILALWVAWDSVWGVIDKGQVSIAGRVAFPVFRGCFGLVAWHWFWGMSVYIWTRYRINYIYLFEFDPRNVATPVDIFNDAVDETLVLLICMILYYKADAGDMPNSRIPPYTYPTFLIFYAIKCLLFPWNRRKELWLNIKQVFIAPLVSPTFFQTYVGDVFTSMVKIFQDLLWTACFILSGDFLLSVDDQKHGYVHAAKQGYASGWHEQFWYKNIAIPLICMFPLWLRLNQCLRKYLDTGNRMPHLANAFKYSMSQMVTLFGAFHPLYLMHYGEASAHPDGEGGIVMTNFRYGSTFQYFWFFLFISSSLYSFCWDVYMDWGLGRREYGYLGPRLMFKQQSYYYLVMCVDLVLRFLWVLTLVPPQSGAEFQLPVYLSAVQMMLELFRRTVWSFFRLENEHRQNTEGYRKINVVPLHFDTGHKHKYKERHRAGWKVLVEIAVVTTFVVFVSAYSVIVAQRQTHKILGD